MLPLPPLDGSAIVSWLLPEKLADAYNSIGPFGLFILLGLVAAGLLGPIMSGPIGVLMSTYDQIFGLGLRGLGMR
jgi:Zn-dependent protease